MSNNRGSALLRHPKSRMIDLTKVLARYCNCWVALAADETHVVASARHPREALRRARAKGELDPILMWAPKESCAYIV
jgi:hypothetical protein